MDTLGSNPFSLLTFLVAPAILTNASSIMVLSTSNRFGLAIDRVKTIAAEIEVRRKGSGQGLVERTEQLKSAERRVLLLVRTLTTLYLAVGSFVTAGLIALFGALMFIVEQDLLRLVSLVISFLAGLTGVGALVTGCCLLIRESRVAYRLLSAEIDFKARHNAAEPVPTSR
jgi:hypothetical protein